MIETLKSLCALSGVSGDEGDVRGYIINRIRDHAADIKTDVMGNLLVSKKGAKTPAEKIVFCSHMDEVGVIVTSITDDGYLKFGKAGDVDSRVLVGKTLWIGKQRIFGAIGTKAIHLTKAKDREKALERDDLYIDIGAKNHEDAEKLVKPGDLGAFDDDIREFGNGFIKAKAIDDRFGCAVLLKLIESELPIDCFFAFTVQEEVGMRGAYTAAFRTAPDIAVIIEGTSVADLPSVPDHKKVCKAGDGPVIPFMDGASIYDRELRGRITEIADKNEIKWQTKNVVAGATDGAAFQRSRAGVKTVAISAPIRNLHSPSCVGKVSDMEAVFKLAMLFLEDFAAGLKVES